MSEYAEYVPPPPPLPDAGEGGPGGPGSSVGAGSSYVAVDGTGPRDFREHIVSLAPSWLRGILGSRFLGYFGLTFDVLAEAAQRAALSHSIVSPHFPRDALPLVGSERMLPRYPRESDGTYAERLFRAWAIWRRAGTDQGVKEQLLLIPGVATVTFKTAAEMDPDHVHIGGRRWVVITGDFGPPGTLGDGSVLGGGGTLGSTAGIQTVEVIRRVVRLFKSGHIQVPHILVQVDTDEDDTPLYAYWPG
jgi:hypothetical protein